MSDQQDDKAELRGPLEAWLRPRMPEITSLQVGEIAAHGSGYSAETIVVPYSGQRSGQTIEEKVVLRMECPEPAIYPAQAPGLDVEVDIQYRSMVALGNATSAPLAPLVGYEGDASVLGQPFFVMGFVEGLVPIVNPAYTREGFFAEAKPDERRQMIDSGLRVLAAIHQADYQKAGFDWLVPQDTQPGTKAQLELWQAFAMRELKGRDHPLLNRAFEWLWTNLPEDEHQCISWGDSRPGNIIYQNFEPACLTDFENIAIAPPEFDLGWWLMFDWTMHEAEEIPRLEGEPSREEQCEIYARYAGRELRHIDYYEVLAAARYVGIVARVTNRYVDRGLFPADHGVWLDNPPAKVLALMLEKLDG